MTMALAAAVAEPSSGISTRAAADIEDALKSSAGGDGGMVSGAGSSNSSPVSPSDPGQLQWNCICGVLPQWRQLPSPPLRPGFLRIYEL